MKKYVDKNKQSSSYPLSSSCLLHFAFYIDLRLSFFYVPVEAGVCEFLYLIWNEFSRYKSKRNKILSNVKYPNDCDLCIIKLKYFEKNVEDWIVECRNILEWIIQSGENPIEQSVSWFFAKTIEVVRHFEFFSTVKHYSWQGPAKGICHL